MVEGADRSGLQLAVYAIYEEKNKYVMLLAASIVRPANAQSRTSSYPIERGDGLLTSRPPEN